MSRETTLRPTIASDLVGRAILLANRLELSYWAIRLLGRAAAAAPLRAGHAVAGAVADLVWAAWPGIRARTSENMAWVVAGASRPEPPARLARAAFRNYFRYLVEFLRFPSLARSDLQRLVEVRGVEHLHAAMARGRGVVAIGFHLGNIDLGAAVLAQQGYPVNVVVDTFEPPRLDALIQEQRARWGMKLLRIAEAPRGGLRALRGGEILALLIDRPTPGEGVTVNLFGGPVALPAGAAVLAARTGAPIVPCCVFRLPGGRFLAEVAPPIDPGEPGADATSLTQRMVDQLERWVRRHPEQWYPFRRMWLVARTGRG